MTSPLENYDLIISDIDGVVLREDVAIRDNLEALRELKRKGKRMIFITNNSGFSRLLLSRQLRYLGLDVNPDDIVTSGVAAVQYLKERTDVRRVFVVGEEGLMEELRMNGFQVVTQWEAEKETPDAVVLGLDRLATYDKLSTAMRCIHRGAMFVVTNMDRLWPSNDGLRLGAGALASAIMYALRREPDFVAGKPNGWILEVAKRVAKIPEIKRAVVIGDQLETDIRMGNENGYDTVLVLTGISKREDIERLGIRPTYVVNTLKELL
jgi:4-nitrophenyl phosphatase